VPRLVGNGRTQDVANVCLVGTIQQACPTSQTEYSSSSFRIAKCENKWPSTDQGSGTI